MNGFLQAIRTGNASSLVDLLSEDVTLVADGGGKVVGAATHVIFGRSDVAQFSVSASRKFLPPSYSVEMTEVNGQPAVIGRTAGRAIVVLTIEAEDGMVKTLRFMANPEKLAHL